MRYPTIPLLIVVFTSNLLAAEPATRPTTQPATQPLILGPGDSIRRLQVYGLNRSYLYHLPPNHDPRKPAPVVLIYHGAMMNGPVMAQFCQMSRKADKAGFIAVYPNGTGLGEAFLFFNSGGMPRRQPADDVKFTSMLLDDLATVVSVDPNRVYATGISNGGMMCYRLAAELSHRIAAIAPVAGTMTQPQANPQRPVPVIHFHGTADTIVPFGGPNQKTPRFAKFKSVRDSVLTWAQLDACPEFPKVTQLPDEARDGTTITQEIYGPGKDDAEVILVTIVVGGHTWPGQQPPVQFIGKSTKNISANDMIWDFFLRHPMKGNVAPEAVFEIKCQKNDDAITATTVAGKTILSLTSASGIGNATIERKGDRWPDELVLQIHLRGLESLSISGGNLKLTASVLSHSENQKLLHLWTDGKEGPQLKKDSPHWMDIQTLDAQGKPTRELPAPGGYFQMAVPKALLADKSRELNLGWVDFYR